MPDIAVTIPEDFKYVGASIVSTLGLLFMQYRNVVVARARAKIPYPQTYAEKAEMEASKDAHLFNCAQRAHQNTLENLPLVYVTTIVTGLRYPIFAATACGLWVVGKVAYTRGYSTGDPAKRNNPIYAVGGLGLLGLTITSFYIALDWAFADLLAYGRTLL